MKLGYGQVLHTIIEDYLMSVYFFIHHLMLELKKGTKIKYHFPTKIARRMDKIIPKWKDWQNSQVKSLWKNSFGALTCNHSRIPHFVASVRKNITASATKST